MGEYPAYLLNLLRGCTIPRSLRHVLLISLVPPQVLVLFYATMTSLELALGIGDDSSSSSSAGPSAVLLLDNVARTLALTALAWSKSAFACGLLYGTRPVGRVRLALLGLVGVLNAVVVGAVVFHWARCRPLHKAWDVDVDGACFGWGVRNAVQITAQGECVSE